MVDEYPDAQTPPRLTPQRLYADPPLSGRAPRGVSFSPDGSRLLFPLNGDLYLYEIATSDVSRLYVSLRAGS